jgi:hypothetical protein
MQRALPIRRARHRRTRIEQQPHAVDMTAAARLDEGGLQHRTRAVARREQVAKWCRVAGEGGSLPQRAAHQRGFEW